MEFLGDWLTIVIIGCLAIMSPGANFVVTVRSSLTGSKQAGVYTALGLALGDLVHIAYCLVGIGVVISQSIVLFNVLKWVGAIYLIYVGIKALQAKKQQIHAIEIQSLTELNSRSAMRIGFFTCLLNPKVTLFFLALFTQVIHPNTPMWLQIIYGLTVAAIELIWFAFVAIIISQPLIKRRFLSIAHWFERVMGAILILLGLRLALAETND